MKGQDRMAIGGKEDPKKRANQPFAAAMGRARALAHVTLDEWAQLLTENGAPATHNQVHTWEVGVDPRNRNAVIVPAYALVAAARVTRRTLGELLSMGGERESMEARVQDHEARIRALEVLVGVFPPNQGT